MKWPMSMALAAVLLCGCMPLAAQGTRVEDLGIGKLLVTPRDAPDPSFAESVILLVRYDRGGTLGLMLNRRSKVPLSRALRDSKAASGRADPIYIGGPVDLKNVLALVRANVMPEGAAHVVGKVYLASTRDVIEKSLQSVPEGVRVYLGYCGWEAGQLENEVSHGMWHVFPGSTDAAFDADSDTLWSRLDARAGQNIAQGRPTNSGGTSPFSRRNAPMMPYISLSWVMFQLSKPSFDRSQTAHFTFAAPAASVMAAYTGSQ
jgi:putative transcriptional regulator